MPESEVTSKVVKLRRYPFDPNMIIEVTLVNDGLFDDRWTVYLGETKLGEVSRTEGYVGESKVGRGSRMIEMRRRVIRTVWESYPVYHGNSVRNMPSRADAIRHMLNVHRDETERAAR